MNGWLRIWMPVIVGAFLLIPHTSCAHAPAAAEPERECLTNPLLKYMKFRELKSFKSKLEPLVEQLKTQGLAEDISVYFRSLPEGMWTGINPNGAFCPASILKVPVLMTYFKMAETHPEVLTKKIKYAPRNTVGYVPGLVQHSTAEYGKEYTVDELIHIMITESDNNADALLFYNLPAGALEKTFANFGLDVTKLSSNQDFVSLKLIATFLRVLYNASYLNEAMSEKALRYLTESAYHDGIIAGLPKNLVVAHKFGERFLPDTKELHEVAIVYYDHNPYLLAIMTRGNDNSKLSRVLQEISAFIYKEVDSQYHTSEPNSSPNIE